MKKIKKNPTKDKKEMKSRGGIKWLIGIDEVGRGPLAGPVSVGLFAIRIEPSGQQINFKRELEEFKKQFKKTKIKITDSKKMSPIERLGTYQFFKKKIIENSQKGLDDFHFDVMHKSSQQIDQGGIAVCIADLVERQIKTFAKKFGLNSADEIHAFLDGGLKTKLCSAETIIKGDLKNILISGASIMAKVTRDNLMQKMSKKYPAYNLDVHKGYGTKSHIEQIKKYGLSEIHRRSFTRNLI
jgi:ribonuclease HII